MSKVIFTNSDGTVSIMTPIEGTAEECAKRDLPDGTSYEIVDDSVIPTDRSFRNAWKQNSKTIETDMTKAIDANILEKHILPLIPKKRLATANEIAKMVRYLCSDDASFITGETMSINGGQYMK